jgi:hypothetical protein
MTARERVQIYRDRHRRQEVLLDLVEGDQVARFAKRWECPRQEVLKMAFRACLPTMRKASSAQDLFNRVRDALEAAGTR